MKICIYANCQGLGIEKFIKIGLYEKCHIFTILNYEKLANKTQLEYDVISDCDLFIYQHLTKSHGVYSTESDVENGIINYLKPECCKISVPFVYNSSLWSMFMEGEEVINKNVILELKNEGYSLQDILYMYDNFQLDFNYDFRSKYCRDILREKEKNCDIKVADFIDEEILNLKLFLTQNHPTSVIFTFMVNQIFDLLDIKYKLVYKHFDENYSNLPGIYKHNKYDIKHWNFKYPVKSDGDVWTKKLIEKIYEK